MADLRAAGGLAKVIGPYERQQRRPHLLWRVRPAPMGSIRLGARLPNLTDSTGFGSAQAVTKTRA